MKLNFWLGRKSLTVLYRVVFVCLVLPFSIYAMESHRLLYELDQVFEWMHSFESTNAVEVLRTAEDCVQSDIEHMMNGAVNVNMRDEKGFTALMHAAFCGYVAIVEGLLMHGADVHVLSNGNFDALDFTLLGMILGEQNYPLHFEDMEVQDYVQSGRQHVIALLSRYLNIDKNAVRRRALEVGRWFIEAEILV